jgi:uncharacterized protein with HEPN domain
MQSVRHILDAADAIEHFLSNRSRDDFQRDDLLFWGIVKLIENAGEAAVKLSAAARDELSDVPWLIIIATRNRLVHAYLDLDRSLVWEAATTGMPQLARMLRQHLSGATET